MDSNQFPFFTGIQATSQDPSSSKFNYFTQIANLLEMPLINLKEVRNKF